MTRFGVIRVPTTGPSALIATPYDFDISEEAEARVREVETRQRMAHHTYLHVLAYRGPLQAALEERGILY